MYSMMIQFLLGRLLNQKRYIQLQLMCDNHHISFAMLVSAIVNLATDEEMLQALRTVSPVLIEKKTIMMTEENADKHICEIGNHPFSGIDILRCAYCTGTGDALSQS
jgi:hypothetical protein